MHSIVFALVFAAQAVVDPTGHWEGVIQLPGMEMKIEIDLAKNGNGELAATFTQPSDAVKGLPFSIVSVEGRSVRLVLRGGDAPSTFEAVVSGDGKSMSGDVTQAGQSVRFTLARTGDARIIPAPKSAPIGKELEGTWTGALDLQGRQMRLTLKMANQPDGTATGTIVSQDGSGVEIPIGIVQNGNNVTVDVPSVGASFVAILNATTLAGTWKQGPSSLPLKLERATK